MIEGVVVKDLKQFVDDRGRVMHMLKKSDPLFEKFGEVYFSEVLPKVVKAWKKHKTMTQHFAVPVGMIELVIYDDREKSVSKGNLQNIELGRKNYKLVKIPPKLWYGFKCISSQPALIVNCTDLPHEPNGAEIMDPYVSNIPYRW